jgi:PAS domain S-box-containing protein
VLSLASVCVADEAATTQTVLLLYGESRLLPSIVAADEAIRATLTARSPRPLTFHTEYLESLAGPHGASFEPELARLLGKKYADVKPDVIIAGRGAADFVLARRAEIFPGVPLVLLGLGRASLATRGAGPGVVAIFTAPEWAATLDVAVALQPGTRRVMVVHGGSSIDREWAARARQELAPYERRVEVQHVTVASLETLLAEVARLPDGSIVLVGSVIADTGGRALGARLVVQEMSKVSPRPIYGLLDRLLGDGIVGGRLLVPAAHGVKAAELALRILDGETLNLPDSVENVGSAYMFDARQLARWGISESALPASSIVRFREISLWTLYRWQLIGGLSIVVIETALIAALLVERRRRRMAQQALGARLRFEHLLADLTATFATLRPSEVEPAIDQALARVVDVLDVDRAALAEFASDSRSIRLTHRQRRPGLDPISQALPTEQYPWTAARMFRGECVTFASVEDLPAEAELDRQTFRQIGTRSFASVPLRVAGVVVGALRVATTRTERAWSAEFLQQLELLSEIFGNALASRRAEAARREQEERFRTIADAAPVMIWMAGTNTKCDFINKPWLEFTGRRMEQELGAGWVEGVHPEDVHHCLEVYLSAFNERRPFRMEYRLRRHDGEYRWILDSGSPRRTADGVFTGYVGSCVDVTEVKQAHLAVINSSALSDAMLASLHGRVAALDARGNIIAVNQTWTDAVSDVGGIARTAVGDNYVAVCRFTDDPDSQRAAAAVQDVLAHRTTGTSLEYVCPDSLGARWFEMTVEPLKRPEGGALVSHVDITDRRRADEELRQQREELAHALRLTTLGEMAASLSHEMNQPLTAILSSAQAARRVLDTAEPDRGEIVRSAIEYIIEDSKRAAQVIRRLRALFRKEQAERKPIYLNEIVMDVVGLIRGDAARRAVSLRFELADGLPAVPADVVQLQQVLLNLIVNAMEATSFIEDPREVTITTLQAEAGLLRLSVRDTGVGVEDSQLDKIFEPFVSTKNDGLGMGLSISRSIVQAHGGRIWAVRNSERGLTVHVELPCEERP